MKKIGILALALVMALGSLGIGYAAWTDTLTIDGTINTGTVDLEIYELSDTLVYKDLDTDGVVISHLHKNVGAPPPVPGGLNWDQWRDNPPPENELLVASAISTLGTGENEVIFTWDNLFPSIDFTCDLVWHYNGSIPVKAMIDWGLDAESDWLLPYLTITQTVIDSQDAERIGDCVWEGYQLHYSDVVKLEVTIHLEQLPELMNQEASGHLNITVIQWNEYGLTPP